VKGVVACHVLLHINVILTMYCCPLLSIEGIGTMFIVEVSNAMSSQMFSVPCFNLYLSNFIGMWKLTGESIFIT
jgi:hypothetical protein